MISTIIGVTCLCMGVFGIFENGLTALLMATDPQMRNPTYIFMINLSITDVIILLPIAFYAGLTFIFPNELVHPAAVRIGAFLTALGWYPGCLFLVFASFSRYVQLTKPHKIPVYFTRRRLIWTISLSYLVSAVLYTNFLYYNPMPFKLVLEHYTWSFNRKEAFGNALSIVNISLNSIFALCINFFNMKSLRRIRKMRSEVQSFQTSSNQKREIKLFIQCAITGTIYTATVIYYFAESAVEDWLDWYEFLVTHLLWISNHLQNPIIYFVLNTRLRQRAMLLFKKIWQLHPATSNTAQTTGSTPACASNGAQPTPAK